MSKYLIVLLAASLSACGMKGSLELPPGPPPEPLLGNAKSAKPAEPAAKDVSTDKNRSSK
ncbi:MAG: hypothetical protein H6R10_1008 [Rhodocyclaceae bacterium]|nr:hypothetical protein [Rhodocyclaceae bacterium]